MELNIRKGRDDMMLALYWQRFKPLTVAAKHLHAKPEHLYEQD
jgi:hypothetical protein